MDTLTDFGISGSQSSTTKTGRTQGTSVKSLDVGREICFTLINLFYTYNLLNRISVHLKTLYKELLYTHKHIHVRTCMRIHT